MQNLQTKASALVRSSYPAELVRSEMAAAAPFTGSGNPPRCVKVHKMFKETRGDAQLDLFSGLAGRVDVAWAACVRVPQAAFVSRPRCGLVLPAVGRGGTEVGILRSAVAPELRELPITKLLPAAWAYAPALRCAAHLLRSHDRRLDRYAVGAVWVAAGVAGIPWSTLDRFCRVMHTGEIAGRCENAAIRARTCCLAWSGNDMDETVRFQRRLVRAVAAFADQRPLGVLYEPRALPYPWLDARRW